LDKHRVDCHDLLQNQATVQSGGRHIFFHKKFSPYPFREIEAFRKGYLQTFRQRVRRLEKPVNSVGLYFHLYGSKLTEIQQQSLKRHNSIKLQITLLCEFIRKDEFYQTSEACLHYVNSSMKVILNKLYTEQVYNEIVAQIEEKVQLFKITGSGWILDECIGSDVRITQFELFKGGCFLPIPKGLQLKRTIVNTLNSGSECFKRAFLAGMHYSDVSVVTVSGFRKHQVSSFNPRR
jgi:hypothetical protein